MDISDIYRGIMNWAEPVNVQPVSNRHNIDFMILLIAVLVTSVLLNSEVTKCYEKNSDPKSLGIVRRSNHIIHF